MRGASGLRDEGLIEEVLKVPREEFACVVRVERAHYADWLRASAIEVRVEFCHEAANDFQGVGFAAEKVDEFVPRVIIDEDEDVMETPDCAALERAYDVRMNETASVGGFVHVFVRVSGACGVGLETVDASGPSEISNLVGHVGCHASQPGNEVRREVECLVELGSELVGA